MKSEQLTPMMRQFREAKAAHPDMLVFFRNGDFYELFEADAELGHQVLGLTLTKRDKEMPMAGFPHHKLEHYLALLLKSGQRVAVCDPLENAPIKATSTDKPAAVPKSDGGGQNECQSTSLREFG